MESSITSAGFAATLAEPSSLDSGCSPPPADGRAHSLRECFQTQCRVIGALIMREMLTRYGRHNIGFMWLFAEPMMFTLGVTALWTIMGAHKGDGISITAFVLTGYSTILLWRNMPSRCLLALGPNHSLMFHRQVKPIDVYFSRLILEAVGATISLVILSIIFIAAGLVEPPKDYMRTVLGWSLLAWYAFALSLLVGAISERTEIIERIWHIFQYLMIPLSGSFFIVDSLPKAFQNLVLLNPTVNCTELFRAGFFGDTHEWHYSIEYVVLFNMVLTLVGLSQVRYVSRNLVLEQ
jgi:ABC-type polysaccharide/polyol phosphate export permease